MQYKRRDEQQTTSEDRATQLLICEALSFAISMEFNYKFQLNSNENQLEIQLKFQWNTNGNP